MISNIRALQTCFYHLHTCVSIIAILRAQTAWHLAKNISQVQKYACSHASAALHYLSKGGELQVETSPSQRRCVQSLFISNYQWTYYSTSTEPVLHVLTNSIRLFRKSVRTGTGLNFLSSGLPFGGGAAWTRRLFFRLQFSGSSFKLNFQTLDIKLEGSSVNLKTFQHKETSITITSSGNSGNAVGWTFKLEAPSFHIWNWLGCPVR